MPEEKKNYADLKKPPKTPEFPEEEENAGTDDGEGEETEEEEPEGAGGEGEGEGEGGDKGGNGEGDKGDEETPVWAKDIVDGVSKLNERLDGVDKRIAASEIPTGEPDDQFKPDHEKRKYLPPDYKPKNYNDFVGKVLDAADARAAHNLQVKTEQEEGWNKEWTRQLDQLTSEGKIPEIKDQNDKNDPGRKARATLLFDAAKAKSPDLIAFYNVTSKYRKAKTPKKPPSSNAPVGGESGGEGAGKGKRTYAQTKKPVEEAIQEAFPDS